RVGRLLRRETRDAPRREPTALLIPEYARGQFCRLDAGSPFSLCFKDAARTKLYTLSLHDALPISVCRRHPPAWADNRWRRISPRSEEHTSELQSLRHLVCRLLLEKKKSRWSNATSRHRRRSSPASNSSAASFSMRSRSIPPKHSSS